MVDLLLYDKGMRFRNIPARAKNYYGAGKDEYVDEDAPKTRSCPPPVNYLIRIVHDPLDVGGFKPGVGFSVVEYTEMKHRCAFTPGTILDVRGTLRIIRRRNGYQVASRHKKSTSASS